MKVLDRVVGWGYVPVRFFDTKLSVYEGNLVFVLVGESDLPMKLVGTGVVSIASRGISPSSSSSAVGRRWS
jgi:hypothetical protein